jgi:excisionase family DNA binding protein
MAIGIGRQERWRHGAGAGGVGVSILRFAIIVLACLLLLLSIAPIRRRLPGLRGWPAIVEVLLWLAFVALCLVALSSVRTIRSTELSQATARAAVAIAGQAFDSLLGPAIRWVSLHEPGVALVTVAMAGLGWAVVATRAVTVFRRARQPRPRLEDWWVVKSALRAAPLAPVEAAPSAVPAAFLDARAAALYLGVSRATVYRWARAGRLRSKRAGARLHFSSGDLAALQPKQSPGEQRA